MSFGIKTATPKDTYDHVFGCGALDYSWWLKTEQARCGVDEVADDWEVTVTAEGGDDGHDVVVKVNHKLIMRKVRYVVANKGKKNRTANGRTEYPAWSAALERECCNLMFDADEVDIDAAVGDELLQLCVLDEVIYG